MSVTYSRTNCCKILKESIFEIQKRYSMCHAFRAAFRMLSLKPEDLQPLTRVLPLFLLSHLSQAVSNTQPGEGEIALPEVAKTGLGSSAAMTTAVVASLLQYFGQVDLPMHGATEENVDADLQLVHCVAQAAHCAA